MIKACTWRIFLWLHKDDIVQAAYRGVLGREADHVGFEEHKKNLARSHDILDLLTALARCDEFRDKNVASLAPDLVRAVYLGLLGREPDPETSSACCSILSGKRELHAVLADVIRSNGLYDKIIPLLAPDLVRSVFRGLLGREPDPEAEDAYSAEYPEIRELPGFLSDIIGSDEFLKRIIASRAPDLVRAAYQGLFGKGPDPEAEAAYSATLSENPELSALLDDIIGSTEFWKKTIAFRGPELVRAAYRGLLGREPEWEAMAAYCAILSEKMDLPALLTAITQSEEFWEQTIASHAPDLVRAAYQGVLGREPDPQAMAEYTVTLSGERDLPKLLSCLTGSDELRQKIIAARAPDLVRAIYRLLLGREPDEEGLENYVGILRESNDLGSVLPSILDSDEFCKAFAKMKNWPKPAAKYNDPCVVLLHMQRTGGTSVQNHLRDFFGPDHFYREHSDSLHMYPPGELCNYDFFAGHFNYDSLEFIPRKKLSIITFVREPKKRLVSLYHFLRIHEPSHALYGEGMEMANQMMIEEFFESEKVREGSGYWNHMTWAIMGERQWLDWQAGLRAADDAPGIKEIVKSAIRPAIVKRLKEFIFIGLQEDFDRSVQLLFQTLQQPQPTEIMTFHSLELLMRGPGFKTSMEKQPFTSRLDAALDGLVQLDNIVYEESAKLYKNRLAELPKGGESGPRLLSTDKQRHHSHMEGRHATI